MATIQPTVLFFGVYLALFGGVLVTLAFVLFYKYLGMERYCTCQTDGIVVGYTTGSYGEFGSGVFLPRVRYAVGEREYDVVGPRYRGYVTSTYRTPIANNTYTCHEKNDVLYIKRRINSLVGICRNPMEEMYPIGMVLPVWYNPEKPKHSYVLRCPNRQLEFWVMLLMGLSIWLLDVLMFVLL